MIQMLRHYSHRPNSWLSIRYVAWFAWRTSAYYTGLLPYDGVDFDSEFFCIWEEF